MDKKTFSELVYEIVRMVPEGRATSYGFIARAIGFPTASRRVGKVMGECDLPDLPAHRVVNSQGILSGRDSFGEPDLMQKRLESEGVEVVNHRIKNWKSICWNPLNEI